jgi:hypothetical protein
VVSHSGFAWVDLRRRAVKQEAPLQTPLQHGVRGLRARLTRERCPLPSNVNAE